LPSESSKGVKVFKFQRFVQLWKRVFTPVTILLIPHSKNKPLNFQVPFIGIFLTLLLSVSGFIYIFTMVVNTFEYYRMREKLNYYSAQFIELHSTISSLKKAEDDFRKLFSLGSKEKVLENVVDASDRGSINMEELRKQIRKTVQTVGEIKAYLHVQRDIYKATPRGLPVEGYISSNYGYRMHPISGKKEFHSGIDISTSLGSCVRATADGIVIFSGWSAGNGNLVVIEHGRGLSTVYAHNKKTIVRVGQMVRRGDIIAYAGSTGTSTGPHVHYEVWKYGKHINPDKFIMEAS
jgi:murein DD-endopeptidase MepM/ murein hydrolase activator NlpD